MTPDMIIDVGRQALFTVFTIAAPMMLAAMLIGVTISVLQSATQIQEQTLSFVPKIAGVLLTMLLFAPFFMKIIIPFTIGIISSIGTIGN